MSVIKQALSKLEGAVGHLEDSIIQVEETLAGQQRDMFAAPAKKNGNGQALQGALFAKRLDQTIEKVEELLGEG